jgi:uncharacterized membrane protein YgdD (TMEM256/DUF423 family)
MMPKLFLMIAAGSGLIAVILGAFGAHALRAQLDQASMSVWQTAVQYQFFHTLALLAVAKLALQMPRPLLTFSAAFFTVGLLMFSGSLYLLAVGGPRWLGPVTPVGGLCFMIGWACLGFAALSANPKA